ncbi:unnamed protein product [Arabis nemorensis]|uniref:Uncharacterized protein n=1 Tax=Arabis nemorensis TaxID=586526 RepID=A0A565C168_9BRAS|nr:unnamed protein product [Arabis nemorensis]
MLLKDAILSGKDNSLPPMKDGFESEGGIAMLEDGLSFLSDAPTGYRTGFYEAGSSGKSLKKGKPRRRLT